MLFPTTFLLLCVFFSRVAGSTQNGRLNARDQRPARLNMKQSCKRNVTTSFNLKDMYHGADFFNKWTFFAGADPTRGSVTYQSKDSAIAKGLAFIQDDGATVLAVDDKKVLPLGGKRDSVRITSKKRYNGGLFIADFVAMPYGCSVWPAYWTVGPNWPKGGELDVIEGVNNHRVNQMALHTTAGCTLSTDSEQLSSGSVFNKDCTSGPGSNAGCGYLDTDERSYGEGFNAVGGGVYAHLWNSEGIKIWHFARDEIPNDITAQKPNPSNWGRPVSFWSSSSCDFAPRLYDQSLIIDTTLCGDWAGPTYGESGCPGTCAQTVTDPNNFKVAKWKINYIAVYG